ncbi:MATE family efflux transporter [Pseudidiomarina terrestris]|uniref:MATE family efflux transporter n=2 Tax=Pseudidiomarina terrestris TaxID=2820060 RepID=UPI002656FF6E|nr:MATE family efflux transporter [Pseudidiomarina sp. 1ASP75-5]MDN7126179.1 MATE family efflux transporter [Pseudidiomarina sp. 1APR75-33.1]MDN7134204.1 MATE family efflux transporter [Pseudidiomarina sp. 1ASP75-5]MDN7137108.1 MATE family efflux transporter [Pseudidiomarina sp. 1ASP75-14]MEA3588368.1 MATE family efflux transporter [Pseudidiomarina sp. 1APP75-27a]
MSQITPNNTPRIVDLQKFWGSWPAHRKIFAIALPMIISNIAAPLLGLVDTAIIGHLPDAIYLSGVALGAMVVSFIFLLAIFLRMTTTGEIARAFGREVLAEQRQIGLHALAFAVILGVGLLLLTPLILELAWWLIAPSPELQEYATRYIEIRMWAAPAALINLVVLGVLLGRQQSRRAMILVIFTNAVNVIADIILIIGLDMNVAGAAWASVTAEVSTALLGLYLIRNVLQLGQSWHLQRQYFSRFFGMNRDVFLRSLLLQLCMATMTGYAARFGDIYVAVNAVLMQFLMLISLGLDGIAYAVEALAGAAVGRQRRDEVKYWLRLTLLWSMLFAIAYSFLFWLAGDSVVRLLTDLPEVIATAQHYLPWIYVLPLLGHWSYYFDGVFIGLGYTRAMRDTMAVSALLVFVPLWQLAAVWFSNENANHGLWLALSAFLLARGASQWLYLRYWAKPVPQFTT